MEFRAEFGADDVDDGVGFEEQFGFVERDFSAADYKAATFF